VATVLLILFCFLAGTTADEHSLAPKWIRGSIVGSYQLAITIGLLLASIVGNATKDRYDTASYRIPIAVQFAWAIILFGEYCTTNE